MTLLGKMGTFLKIFNSSINIATKQLALPTSNGINLQFVRALPHFIDLPKPGKKDFNLYKIKIIKIKYFLQAKNIVNTEELFIIPKTRNIQSNH